MGTDIHLVAEVINDEGRWEFVPGPIEQCWSCKGEGVVSLANHGYARKEWLAENLGEPCDRCTREFETWRNEDGSFDPNDKYVGEPGRLRDEWFSDRNYDVFGIIGDVRNGRGFGGCDLGDGFNVIASGRGLPDDLSAESLAWFERRGGDHSDNWLGLDEIMAFDWDQTTIHRGYVDAAGFAVWQAGEDLTSWSGDIWGAGIEKVSVETMTRLVATGAVTDRHYCQVSWTLTYRRSAEAFLERMRMLAQVCGEHPARIAFNFDS